LARAVISAPVRQLLRAHIEIKVAIALDVKIILTPPLYIS
jgi:hypothetical protein